MKLLMLIVDKHEIALMVPTLQITQQFQLMPSMLGWKKKSSTSASSEKDEFNNSQPH